MTTILSLLIANWKLAVLGAAALVIIAGALAYRQELITEGETTALDQVEKANAADQSKADAAAENVAVCVRAGGAWNRLTGVCDNAAR